MTLLVALTCKDAVVMATDSQATETQGPNLLAAVRHPTPKLKMLGPHMLWAATGQGGIIQDVGDALESWAAANATKVALKAKRMKPELVKVVASSVKEAYAGWMQVPGQGNLTPATAVLVCGHTDGYRWILEISENGVGEFKEQAGFASLGSAYNLAAVAAAMVSEYAAPTRSLIEGSLLALRILETAVQAAAWGVGGEPQLGIVDSLGARILDRDEVDQLQDKVDQWKRLEAETLGAYVTEPAAALVAESPAGLAAPITAAEAGEA
jgi:20S proteasome alpha/beta subunit